MVSNNTALKQVLKFEVEERTDSDHQPITLIIRSKTYQQLKEQAFKTTTIWNTDSIANYKTSFSQIKKKKK